MFEFPPLEVVMRYDQPWYKRLNLTFAAQHPEFEAMFTRDYFNRFLYNNRSGCAMLTLCMFALSGYDVLNGLDQPLSDKIITWVLRLVGTGLGACCDRTGLS